MPINDIFICLDVVLKGEIPFLHEKREIVYIAER